MQKCETFLNFYSVGDFSLDVFKVVTFNGFNPKVVDFFVEISRGFLPEPYELRHFKSRQGAERFCQRFVARNQ